MLQIKGMINVCSKTVIYALVYIYLYNTCGIVFRVASVCKPGAWHGTLQHQNIISESTPYSQESEATGEQAHQNWTDET